MDAVGMLELAKILQQDIVNLGFDGEERNKADLKQTKFYEFVLNDGLRAKTEKLYLDGHYARAVEEAYKYIDNLVKKRAGKLCKADSGTKLMQEAFSPNNPILMLNKNVTRTEQDEQLGYMQIYAGCMLGIRNPRAHDTDIEDEREHALKLLGFADHLVSRIKDAEVADDSD